MVSVFTFTISIALFVPSVLGVITDFKCNGDSDLNRRCQFKNLLYDTTDDRFVVARPWGMLRAQPDHVGSLRIRTGLGKVSYIGTKTLEINLYNERYCIVASPTYFHTPHHIKSYGHMMRDNWHQIGLNIGTEDREVVLLTNEGISRAAQHYSTYVTPLLTTMNNLKKDGSCLGKRYIVFRNSMMGNGDRDLRDPSKCNSADIQQQRDRVMKNMHVEPVRSGKIRVTVLYKTKTDKRRFTNVDEIVSKLRKEFPNLDVRPMLFLAMDSRENLQTIADTNIFITNIGSPSFRLLHLQDDAHVILVGAPSIGVESSSGSITKIEKPFDEYDNCWKSLTHIKFHKYNVDNVDEIQTRFKRTDMVTSDSVYIRDSDIKLDAQKVAAMISAILKTM